MITATQFLEEVTDLLDILENEGRCYDPNIQTCAYVDTWGTHPGCAVGRRLTPDEKLVWAEINGSYDYAIDETDTPVPEFFKDWSVPLVMRLQSVHDTENDTRRHAEIIGGLRDLNMPSEQIDNVMHALREKFPALLPLPQPKGS